MKKVLAGFVSLALIVVLGFFTLSFMGVLTDFFEIFGELPDEPIVDVSGGYTTQGSVDKSQDTGSIDDQLNQWVQDIDVPDIASSSVPYVKPDYKGAEKKIYDALLNLDSKVNLAEYKVPIAEVGDMFVGVLDSNPQLFYVAGEFGYTYSAVDRWVEDLEVAYLYPDSVIPKMTQQLETKIAEIVSQIPKGFSEVEKVLFVNEYLASNMQYGMKDVDYSAYDALIDGIAVCAGYSKAFGLLMDSVGIENRYVSSVPMEHAWNMVKLNGEWYHVDVTWNDPVPDGLGRVSHKNFLLSDKAISATEEKHYGWSDDIPAALDDSYANMFWRDVDSRMIYHDGKWYFVYSPANFEYSLMSYDFQTQKLEVICSLKEPVDSSRWSYMLTPMYIFERGGELYYNTAYKVYKIGFDGKNKTEVYSAPLSDGEGIMGIAMDRYRDDVVLFQVYGEGLTEYPIYSFKLQ